jgi:hypothetical protein
MKQLTKSLNATIAVAFVTMGSVQAVTTTITGTTATGSGATLDSWNQGANWSGGVPSGTIDSEIASGLTVHVSSDTTPSYNGILTMGANSRLQFNEGTGANATKFNALGTGIVMNTGATIDTATQADPSFPIINLLGNGFFISSSSAADRDNRAFDGAISGAGSFNLTGRNVEVWSFNTTNNYSGGSFFSAADRYVIRATATGAFGVGDVTINPRANADLRSVVLNVEASGVFASAAFLTLSGNGGNNTTGFFANFDSTQRLMFLATGTSNTVSGVTVNGDVIPAGEYTGADFTWLGGTGTLTVAPIPEPTSALLGSLGVLLLLRRRK